MTRRRLKLTEDHRSGRWNVAMKGAGRHYEHIGHVLKEGDGSGWRGVRTWIPGGTEYVGNFDDAITAAERIGEATVRFENPRNST